MALPIAPAIADARLVRILAEIPIVLAFPVTVDMVAACQRRLALIQGSGFASEAEVGEALVFQLAVEQLVQGSFFFKSLLNKIEQSY